MSSVSRGRTSQGDHLLEGTYADQGLATMDTQTKVTNSHLASGNPTPAPCAQCTSAQAPNATIQLAHIAQPGHVLLSASRPTHALVHGPALANVLETYPHKHDTLISHPGLLGTSGLRAVQTLQRSGDTVLNPKCRPTMVAGNPAAFGRIVPLPDTGTLQMIAHSSQVIGATSQPQSQSQQSTTSIKPSSMPSGGNLVVAGLVTPDGSVAGASNAARIAQLLTPSALSPGVANAPVMLYYTQAVIQGGKPAVSVSEEATLGSQSPSQQHQQQQQQQLQQQQQHQQPTVYYAVATNDLLRQLQASHSGTHDPHLRPQLIQTPSGLVLLQPQAQTSQQQHQQQQQQQQPSVLSQSGMHASLTSSLKLSANQVVSSLSSGVVESATLPRQARSETGLICTCPPEVHQALFEQQRRQKQQQQQQQQQHHQQQQQQHQQQQATRTASQDRKQSAQQQPQQQSQHQQPQQQQQSTPWSMKTGSNTTDIPADHRSMGKCQHKQVENGCVSRCYPDTTTSAHSILRLSPCCSVAHTEDKRSIDHHSELSGEERAEKEAHVNYLVTLFQALRASGVQPDSFLVALQRTELPIPTTELKNKQRYAILAQSKSQLDECRQTLTAIRQLHKHFRQKLSDDIQHCQESLTHSIHQYRSHLHCPTDPSLQSVRTDRASLDRMLVELRESRASLAEQLHDLECVIEQTGNDVLQHRCRITVPYVQTLDSRLDSINRAVSSTCALYPDLRQRIANQEEAELRAIDVEKRLLDEHLHQLEDIGEKCKRIKGTIVTLRRLAIVNVQNRQQASSPRRFAHLGGVLNRSAADPQSLERTRLYTSVKAIQPDSEKRMQAIQQQETLAKQRKRVLALESNREANTPTDLLPISKVPSPSESFRRMLSSLKQQPVSQPMVTASNVTVSTETKTKVLNGAVLMGSGQPAVTPPTEEKKAPLAVYSDDSLSSTTTNGSTSAHEPWSLDVSKTSKFGGSFNPSSVISMIDETSDSTLESQPAPLPAGILKSIVQSNGSLKSPKQPSKPVGRGSRAVMFNTTVTVDDGSEVLRLNCTLDESELGKNRVAPTEKQINPVPTSINPTNEKSGRLRVTPDRTNPGKSLNKIPTGTARPTTGSVPTSTAIPPDPVHESRSRSPSQSNPDDLPTSTSEPLSREVRTGDGINSAPAPPPRRSSQISSSSADPESTALKLPSTKKKEYENLDVLQSPSTTKRMVPMMTPADPNPSLINRNE